MASVWLKLFSMSLLCFNCIAKPTPDHETEFECVSIHKQYALQHPLLKNHRIQIKPSQELFSLLSTSNDVDITETILKGLEKCPKGRVPIYKPKTNLTNNHFNSQQFTKEGRILKHTRKEKSKKISHKKVKKKPNSSKVISQNHKPISSEVISQSHEEANQNSSEVIYQNHEEGIQNSSEVISQNHEEGNQNSSEVISQNHEEGNQSAKIYTETQQHYAILRTLKNTKKKWRGAQALFNVKKPKVLQNQYSKAWIGLNNINGTAMSSIQFGLAVHRALYPDDLPRLTTFWMTKEQPIGCYNALCPGGYVQVHKSIYPGLVYDHVIGGNQNTVHLSVAEDPVTKNWVLTIGSTMIGYWPNQNAMAEGVSEVFFGGSAGISGSSPDSTPSPPMGTGEFPSKDLSRSCFMKQLKYVLSDYKLVDINSNEVETYVDITKCYGLMFLKYVDSDSRETLTFGGPGGQCF